MLLNAVFLYLPNDKVGVKFGTSSFGRKTLGRVTLNRRCFWSTHLSRHEIVDTSLSHHDAQHDDIQHATLNVMTLSIRRDTQRNDIHCAIMLSAVSFNLSAIIMCCMLS